MEAADEIIRHTVNTRGGEGGTVVIFRWMEKYVSF